MAVLLELDKSAKSVLGGNNITSSSCNSQLSIGCSITGLPEGEKKNHPCS